MLNSMIKEIEKKRKGSLQIKTDLDSIVTSQIE